MLILPQHTRDKTQAKIPHDPKILKMNLDEYMKYPLFHDDNNSNNIIVVKIMISRMIMMEIWRVN